MNKSELIIAVAKRTGFTKKDATSAVNAVFDAITAGLVADEKVQIPGFGTFEVRTRAAHQGCSPITKEAIIIPASKTVGFKASKIIKDSFTS